MNYVEEDIDILLKKPPMKYTFKPDEPIDIRSTIMYIDFDGRADTRLLHFAAMSPEIPDGVLKTLIWV